MESHERYLQACRLEVSASLWLSYLVDAAPLAYYRFIVHTPIFKLAVLALFISIFISGCDRGSRPNFVGTAAPDFTVDDVDGTPRKISLHDYKGRVVVLHFWASWCAPCVEETPSLVAMQLKLKPHVQVLAISADEDPDAYKRFVATRMNGMLAIRDSKQQSNSLYHSFKFPETYIIDADGVVRRKIIGPIDWTGKEISDYLMKL
jgi:cytochrome c biogenesis protein CcmG/thiol:disulfide interchange protein DsbE